MTQKIFEPFQRATSMKPIPGMGLGLYVVKMIVEGHGGRIAVDTELGHGSRFIVDLPCAATPASSAPEFPDARIKDSGGASGGARPYYWPSCELVVPGSPAVDFRQAGQHLRKRVGGKTVGKRGRDHCLDPRVRLVDEAITEAILLGLGHLTAEDEQLGGRVRDLARAPADQLRVLLVSRPRDRSATQERRLRCRRPVRRSVRVVARLRLLPALPRARATAGGDVRDAAGRRANDHPGALRRLAAPHRERRRRGLRSAGSQQRAGGVADAPGSGNVLPLRPTQPDRSARGDYPQRSASVIAGFGTWPTASTACTAIRRRSLRCRT